MITTKEYILILGGAGYIGSHVNKELTKKGYDTLVFDNLVNGHKEFIKWGDFIQGDLENIEELRLVFKKYSIKAVMHFAGFAYIGESVVDPQKYYLNNLKNTINLLQVMLEYNVKNIIFSSSCATYGNPLKIPIEENHPQNPINPYGQTKLMIEKILKDYSISYGLKYVSLRYFNAAGADVDCEIGEWHEPETHLIPIALDAAIGKREGVTIFGTDYDTKDGTCIRDYIHVTDLADAHVLALEYLMAGGESEIFNLGNGSGFSVKEVIEKVMKITGYNIKITPEKRRVGDPAVLIGSSKKACDILLWTPKYNNIEYIIETAWGWHKRLNSIK